MVKIRDSLLEREQKQSRDDRVFILVLAFLTTILLVMYILFTHVFFFVLVDGASMNNTLQHGDGLIANSLAKVDRGDVVIIQKGNKLIIKRVIALEGDIVRIDNLSHKVYITGKDGVERELKEDYILSSTTADYGTTQWLVGKNEVFYMGDNRENSEDSRKNGCCLLENVIGVVGDFSIQIKGFTTWLFKITGGHVAE